MAGDGEAIWHVIIGEKQEQKGPLTGAQILAYLESGVLAGGDLIWRSGLTDWKQVSEIDEFRLPEEQGSLREQARTQAPVLSASERRYQAEGDEPKDGAKWSLWKSANIGLLFSALTLLAQIVGGHGFELANDAHTASAETISLLVSQIIALPLIFVLIAFARNLLSRRQPKSKASALRGAMTFVGLFLCLIGGLAVYGEVVFSSTEIISGEARSTFVADASTPCIQKQRSLGQNLTEEQIEKYCGCVSEKIADSTTYKQLGSEANATALADLRQKLEAAGNACR
jgi:GYF domain 2